MNFLKKYWAVLLALLLLIAGYFYFKAKFTKKEDINNYDEIVKNLSDSVSYYRDAANNLHSVIAQNQGDQTVIQKAFQSTIDSITKTLKIKDKQIEAYVGIIQNTKGNFIAKIDTVYSHDSTTILNGLLVVDTSYIIPYKDKWIDFTGTFHPAEQTFSAKYSLTDSLSIVSYSKSTGFLGLGAKKYLIDISSNNPSSTITNIHNFELINEKPKRFGIGPTVSVIYMNSKFSVVPGLGITYSLIRF